MPVEKIPIWLGSNKNVDEYGLGTLSAELRDGYIDDIKNVRKRPGVETFRSMGTDARIDGLYWWEKQSLLIVVSDGAVFQIAESDGVYSSSQYSYAVPTDGFGTGVDVNFADYGTILFAANGGKILKITANPATPISAIADVDAPTEVTFLAVLDTYLICNNRADTLESTFWWSVVLEPETWEGDFASAESNVDEIVALQVVNGLIYLVGTRTIEVWYDDGVTPFVPLSQGYIQIGTIAPKSFMWCRDAFYWLDEYRQLTRLEGTQPVRVPPENTQSLTLYLQSLETVSDARAQYMAIDGREFYILTLIEENKTIVFDIRSNIWSFWSSWDADTGNYTRWFGEQLQYADKWNKRFLGHNSNGYVYELSTDYVADGASETTYLLSEGVITEGIPAQFITSGDLTFVTSDGFNFKVKTIEQDSSEIVYSEGGAPIIVSYGASAGQAGPIRTLIRTGQIDHNTMTTRKSSAKYTLLCKRTAEVSTITSMNVKVRWRDDGSDVWSEWKNGSIDDVTPTTFRISWRRNGWYYTRQLEVVNEDAVPLLIVHLEETFDYGV